MARGCYKSVLTTNNTVWLPVANSLKRKVLHLFGSQELNGYLDGCSLSFEDIQKLIFVLPVACTINVL